MDFGLKMFRQERLLRIEKERCWENRQECGKIWQIILQTTEDRPE